jgi:hypothetical protein
VENRDLLHRFTFAVLNEKEMECETVFRNKHFHGVPGWRNWQTQRTQKRMLITL